MAMAKETIYNGEVRYKKATLNHFATKWLRLDVRGKSSKELKEVIVELKKVNKYMYRCITALDYKEGEARKKVTQVKNEEHKRSNKEISRVKTLERIRHKELQRKSVREAESVLKSEIRDLLRQLARLKLRLAASLNREKAFKDKLAEVSYPGMDAGFANQYFIDLANEWKDKFDEASDRARKNLMKKQRVKTVKEKVVVEIERKKTVEDFRAEKLLSYVSKPLSDRVVNITDTVLKIVSFLSEKDIPLNDINMIIKGNIMSTFTAQSIGVKSRTLLSMEAKGWFSKGNTGIGNRQNYWFLTTDATKLIKELMDYMSYGKTKL